MLCSSLMQHYFDYTYLAQFPYFSVKLKKLCKLRNKCIRFCLKLEKCIISKKDLTTINTFSAD